jgi:serine protease Do
MSRSAIPLAFLAATHLALPATGRGQDNVDVEKLYQKVVRSTVFIAVPTKDGFNFGSGCLIDADKRLVLTAAHVVREAETASIQFPLFKSDGGVVGDKARYMERIPEFRTIVGEVVFRDARRGLALIRLDRVQENTPAVPLAAKDPSPGATAWNIGGPGALPQLFSITEGKVRAVGDFELDTQGPDGPGSLVKGVIATNPINPGDLGGPLVDKTGSLIGVTLPVPRTLRQVSEFLAVEEVHAFLKEAKAHLEPPVPDPAAKPVIAPTPEPPHVVYTECQPAPRRCCLLRLFAGCGQRRR